MSKVAYRVITQFRLLFNSAIFCWKKIRKSKEHSLSLTFSISWALHKRYDYSLHASHFSQWCAERVKTQQLSSCSWNVGTVNDWKCLKIYFGNTLGISLSCKQVYEAADYIAHFKSCHHYLSKTNIKLKLNLNYDCVIKYSVLV